MPKAYINWILFDENFKYVNGNFSRVGSAGTVKSHYGDASMQNIQVTKNGYLYVYVSNESPVAVFFDNLQVLHTRGQLLEETHYYPFGGTLAGISSKSLNFGNPENKKKYNGIEYENSFDINIGEGFFRTHDPQLGRWWQIDPKPTYENSLYSAMLNNPIKLSDPLGDTTWTYDISGTFLKMIPDKMKNQTHYIDKDEYNKLEGDNTKGGKINNKALGSAVRNNSAAFIGKNSLKELQKILSDPKNKGLEALFVGKVGAKKELSFSQVNVPNEHRSVEGMTVPGDQKVNTSQYWINKAFPGDQSNLFMVGHTHTQEKLDMLLGNSKPGDGSQMALLQYWAHPSGGGDYNTADFHRNKIPEMIATPIGISLYSQAQYVNEKYGYQLYKQYQ